MTDQAQSFIASGKRTLEVESKALLAASVRLGVGFAQAIGAMQLTTGKIVVTGLGKSGHVARKISSTLASTGAPSFFLHPAEAMHGDLGMLQAQDVLLAIAFGGETEEVLAVARHAKRLGVCVVSITGKLDSSLAKISDHVLDGSVEREVCPHNLAPTASTTVALGLGDAVAMALMDSRKFKEQDFVRLHPSGALGRRLATVADIMKPISELQPGVSPTTSFHGVLEAVTRKNYGIAPVLNAAGKLIGVISDGDIRRTLLAQGAKALDLSADVIMSKKPRTINGSSLAIVAFKRMEEAQITSLLVLSDSNSEELIGLIRMHDLLAAKIV
jgi:arabinose-5-phosphate isomerase